MMTAAATIAEIVIRAIIHLGSGADALLLTWFVVASEVLAVLLTSCVCDFAAVISLRTC